MDSEREVAASGVVASRRNRRWIVTAFGVAGVSETLRMVERAAASPKRARSSSVQAASTFLPASQSPDEFALPAALAAVPLDPAAGFDLEMGDFRPTFIPRAGLFGQGGDADRLVREPLVAGLVITCLKDTWWIESEPSGERTFTITAYAPEHAAGGSGKTAMLSGVGTVAPDGNVSLSLQTVPALARSTEHDLIVSEVSIDRDGSYTGHVSVARRSSYKHGHGSCRKRCDKKSQGAKRRCHQRCRRRKKN
ncbi:MAG: hypothetical protein U0031_03055 [Thermomicrobiales bacterium]